jgi:hypothetical protein
MTNPDALVPHSELTKLKDEIRTLSETLATLLFERDELQNVVKPNLDAIYQLEIGQYVLENFTIQIECRRLKREIELIQSHLNRSETPDEEAIKAILDAEFAEWEKQMREMSAALLRSKLHVSSLCSSEDSAELKRLYRKLIKKLHPDLNPNLTELQKSLWLQVLAAYEEGNLELLQSLEVYASLNEPMLVETNDYDLLLQRISKLKAEIDACLKHLETLRTTPPISLRKKLTDPQWINAEQEKLRAQKESLLAERVYLTAVKSSLMRTEP